VREHWSEWTGAAGRRSLQTRCPVWSYAATTNTANMFIETLRKQTKRHPRLPVWSVNYKQTSSRLKELYTEHTIWNMKKTKQQHCWKNKYHLTASGNGIIWVE